MSAISVSANFVPANALVNNPYFVWGIQTLDGIVENVATLVQRQSIVDSDPAANTDARVVEVLVRVDRESYLLVPLRPSLATSVNYYALCWLPTGTE